MENKNKAQNTNNSNEKLLLSDVSKSFFAVVPKGGNENTEKELLLASTKKQAVILYKHWHYILGRLNKNLCVKEFKAKMFVND